MKTRRGIERLAETFKKRFPSNKVTIITPEIDDIHRKFMLLIEPEIDDDLIGDPPYCPRSYTDAVLTKDICEKIREIRRHPKYQSIYYRHSLILEPSEGGVLGAIHDFRRRFLSVFPQFAHVKVVEGNPPWGPRGYSQPIIVLWIGEAQKLSGVFKRDWMKYVKVSEYLGISNFRRKFLSAFPHFDPMCITGEMDKAGIFQVPIININYHDPILLDEVLQKDWKQFVRIHETKMLS